MSEWIRALKKLLAILNLVGTVLAMNNTHTIYSRGMNSKIDYPSKIINHSQIDFIAKK
nr:hypothetical protein [uncultured Cetobacterium sp.]